MRNSWDGQQSLDKNLAARPAPPARRIEDWLLYTAGLVVRIISAVDLIDLLLPLFICRRLSRPTIAADEQPATLSERDAI
jgi:hypothetical protein